MGKRFVVMAVFLIAPALSLGGGNKPIVAVFEIQPKGVKLETDLIGNLTEYLGTSLSECAVYRVMPPGDIRSALMQKTKESYKKCFDQKCQIELGRELAANKMISSSILKIGDSCVVTSRVYDLKTKTAELSAKVEGKCGVNELLASLKEVARKICAKASGGGTSGKLDEILQKSKKMMKKSERAKNAWALIRQVATDESVSVGERAEAVRAYLDEFGKKNPKYREAEKLLAGIPASVRITSDPPGAVVMLDGSSKGTAPVLLAMSAGGHAIKASGDGCFGSEKRLKVEPGQEKSVVIVLERAALIKVSSDPTGARLWVDEEKSGNLPVRLKLHAGEHRLKASLMGYKDGERVVNAKPGEKTELNIELAAAEPGKLSIRTEPAGARVLVDGKEVGEAPLERELAPGSHDLAVAYKDRIPRRQRIELISGKLTDIDLILEKIPPYAFWGHVTFWSGLGLAAFGSLSAYMASSLGDEANNEVSNSLRDKSIAWEGSMFACFTIGGAAMITGIVLWAISPDEDLAGDLTGVSIVPGPDGGFSMALGGRF